MDASRWERVKELFDLALQKEPAQRDAFLNDACSGDDSLRQEVGSLLAAYQEADSTIRTPEIIQAASEPIVQEAIVGRRIGRYQVQQRIGQGGMAAVYLAIRADDQYKKGVALKLIPPGLLSEDLLRRFRNERQTLAALDHPNIVKMLDGGTTDDGLPYLVMDYIEGTPIDEYCDGHKLSTAERLRLFLGVCAAVSYAHQRLVIHRDLKPGNILVTADGTPKLLDFGIAKLLNPEAVATLVLTQTGQRPMTLQYASPEQVRGEPLTNATDIYSLGVILYELLTGHRPHHLKSYTRLGIEQAICEDEPSKPSTVVTKIEEQTHADGSTTSITPERVSRTREGDPKKLRSRLRGDLDAIVMTALRKEPQRRYASVYDFSEDIRRHLERLPVKARPSTARYRGAKFISRHKEMMATVLIFILLLGAGVSWYAIRGGRIGSYRLAPAKGRRSIAVLGFKNLSGKPDEAWLSTALSEMLTTELAAGEKLRTIPGENVARMKIDFAMPESDSLAPDTLQKIYRNLGSNLVVLGSYLSMGGQLRLDLRLQDATNGEILAAISETGRESEVSDLVSRTGASLRVKLGIGEVSGAEVLALKATRPDGPEVARLYSEGLVKLRTFDNLGARDLLQKAVALEPRFPLTHSALARAWSGLGFDENAKQEARKALDLSASLSREEQLGVEGQYRETIKDWGKAVETYRALYTAFPDNLDYGLRLARAQTSAGKGQDALVTVKVLRKLAPPASDDPRLDLEEAVAAQSLGDFTRDQAMAAKAAEKGAAQGARLLVARARGAECRAEHSLGHPKQAQTACEAAQRIFTEAGDLAGRANVLNVSALALTDQGDFAGARAKLDEALSAFREIGNKGGVAMSLGNIARILSNQGNNDGAQKMYVQALAIYREIGDRRGAAVLLHNIGNRLFSKGDLAGARKNLEESLAINREIGRKDLAALTLVVLAQTLERQGDLSGARKRLEDAKSMLRASGDKRYSAIALSVSGELLITEGDLGGARKELQEALRIQNELGNKGQATEVTVSLAELSMEEGHAAETAAPLREAVAEFQKEKAADNEISAQSVLARALLALGKPAEAKQEIARVAELVGKSQNRGARLQMAMVAARVDAALRKPAEAEKKLQAALAEASKYGLVGYQFEARLALGEIEMKSGNSTRGRSRLQALEKEASAKRFVLIAKKAAAARSERPTAASH